MPTLNPQSTTFDAEAQVLASEEGLRSRGITLDPAFFQPLDAGDRLIFPGTPIGRIIGGTRGRAFTTKTTGAALTTSSTSITVEDASIFAPGDALVITAPYARLDLALTWANNDTLSLTLNGLTVVHTVTGFSTLTALATAAAATFQASALGAIADFIAEGQRIHIFGADAFAVSAAEVTAGDGTGALVGSVTALQRAQSVEIIAANGVNALTNTITLAGQCDRALPAGAPIGVQVAEILGITLSTVNLSQTTVDIGCFDSARVYENRLRGWNKAIARALPEIRKMA